MFRKLNVKSGAALLLTVALLLAVVSGCGNKPAETPDATDDLTGCTVQIQSEGGKALEGIGVYVYADATKADMIDYAKTDDKGIATISHSVPAGGVAVLDKVPEGSAAQESYAITSTETKIELPIQLRQQIGKITLGDVMFDFTVTDTNGTTHTLSKLLETKKAVVLNLWYVNCAPCKAEFPYLNETYDKYAGDIEVLAINPEGDSEDAIAAFVTENALRFPTAKGDAAWKDTIATLAYPTTVIIDRFGTVGLIHTGGIDSAKVFEDAFAYFVADGYVQTTVDNIMDVATQENPAPTDPTEPTQAPTESTQAPTEATQAPTESTQAPTEATQAPTESTQVSTKPTQAPTQKPTDPKPTAKPTEKPTEKPTQAPTQKPTDPKPTTGPVGPNTNGTLANPDAPVEQFGFTDFSIEVGAGEKMLVYMIRTMNEATLCINDKDAYVVYKGKTYTPTDGQIRIEIESEGSFTPLQLEIGNSGSSKKTIDVTFTFALGTRENPGKLKTGDNTVTCAAGNDQGTFYTFEATKAGTLTLKVKSVDPDTVILQISISDMQQIPTVVELEEGSTSVSIDLPAGAEAEIVFSTADPNKEWKIPAAEIVVTASLA